MDRIYAGIVSYNPDIEKLRRNIKEISPQVEKVVVFENGSWEQQHIIQSFPDIMFIKSSKNVGIAGALNRLIEWGEKEGYKWMISLDQDSLCPTHFVKGITPYLKVTDNIGIVGPVIVDRNIGIIGHKPKKDWSEVRTCITSGSFNNIEAWRSVDGYDEQMFIDSVDFEYCYRLRKKGYKVIQVSKVKLLHELGQSKKKRLLFWSIDINMYSAFRKYYIARNNVYYPLKHRLWIRFLRGNLRNICMLIVVIFLEDDKREKREAINKGWKDGLCIQYHKNRELK